MTDANSKWPCLAPTNALQAPPRRNDGRVILHFDYDCFYAQVVQNRAPSGALIGRCVGVTQKSILATANYEARRRGVKKLMRIAEARRICPDIVLVDGEDLSPFRDVSKQLYRLVRDAVGPTSPVERLGLDEMFVDATALVDANLERILAHPDKFRPRNDLFVMSDGADGPQGFMFDTSSFAGCIVGDKDKGLKAHVAPSKEGCAKMDLRPNTRMRLLLGSHLAAHLRHRLEHDAGYTASAGIATSKLLSKLAGKVNKPANQTTLLSAGWTGDVEASVDTSADTDVEANTVVWQFMDPLPLRSVPGIGFKTSSLLSSYFISSQQDVRKGETDQMAHLGEDGDERRRGGEDATDEDDFSVVTVMDIRTSPGMSPRLLDSILGGNSNEHRHSTASTILASTGNIPTGLRVWQLLHGVDEAPVRGGRDLPSQISIEDTYTGPRQGALRPDAATAVASELHKLATSLLRRMYVDLLEPAPAGEVSSRGTQNVTYSMADAGRISSDGKTDQFRVYLRTE
ncbi:hypothetical protein HMPREF1624_08690 [Sporothrix schenckii ATCC 58251]|uniref:UmuC domain-containing protein n=1 Tax=Sporothrix schenckii (strain ATCC 58251 / de Perez 2211183) TaxID=1391915 RepID=U7PHD2_SPOS1|nr:hypothetical protein HMPREF1624_08690 [Sporothrix schenckii ATCC 58251]